MKIVKGEEISQNELLELVYLKFGGVLFSNILSRRNLVGNRDIYLSCTRLHQVQPKVRFIPRLDRN